MFGEVSAVAERIAREGVVAQRLRAVVVQELLQTARVIPGIRGAGAGGVGHSVRTIGRLLAATQSRLTSNHERGIPGR